MAGRSHDPKSPYEEDDGVTQLQEDVLALLEAADPPQAINDRIVELVCKGEQEKFERDNASLPAL